MTNEVTVTVLMPAYNAARYISEAICSVLSQTFADFELLIINDGSTDETQNIIGHFTDKRIVLINKIHQGISQALNTGLKNAKGKYIARFDADDICFPERLEKQVNFLEKHPEYVLTGSDAKYILETGEFLFDFKCIAHSHEEIMQKLYFYCPFIHSSVMYKKNAVTQSGGYPEHAHQFEDYLLWIRLAKSGKLFNIPEALIKVRFNPASVTIDEKWRGKNFRRIKKKVIHRGHVTMQESNKLLTIIKQQNNEQIKQGAYYALCGKKFLANNYQPAKARVQIKKAITIQPYRWDNYALLMLSYFPEKIIRLLHKLSPNRL
jgi:glycosyltransferase involved in cell wall biosynthesis